MIVNLRDICAIAEQKNMAIASFNVPSLEATRAALGQSDAEQLKIEHRIELAEGLTATCATLLQDLELAYAMTVHKSQGSEYQAVILSVLQGSKYLLSRNVLYTALTRARQLLILIGSEEVVAQMTANNVQQRRYSGLKLRLQKEE